MSNDWDSSLCEQDTSELLDLLKDWDLLWEALKKLISKQRSFLLPAEWDRTWEEVDKWIFKESKLSSEEMSALKENIKVISAFDPGHGYHLNIYAKYKETLEAYITLNMLPPIREKHNELMLRELVRQWKKVCSMGRSASDVFSPLDERIKIISLNSLSSVRHVTKMCFINQVFRKANINVTDAMIVIINKERDGEQIDRDLLRSVVGMTLKVLDIYIEYFEAPIVRDTIAYYSRKAADWIVEDSCSDYILKAEECLKKERERMPHYMFSFGIADNPVEVVQDELLVVFATQLLEKDLSECLVFLRDDNVEKFSRMYRLHHKFPKGLESVSNIFKQQIATEGAALVQEAEDSASNQHILVRKAVNLCNKYAVYVTDCFASHALFCKVLKEAFEVFCNKIVPDSSTAELLASFSDDVLKIGGNEQLSYAAIEDTLEKVDNMLPYIRDTYLFAEYFRKKLACRLLSDRSVMYEHEMSFLKKLKQRLGGDFISKMRAMVMDMISAKKLQTSFEKYINTVPVSNTGMDMTVTVTVLSDVWPSYKCFDLILPAEMARWVAVFENFYKSKNSKQKLNWDHSLGTCIIECKFDAEDIELIVSTYQAAVLMLFNDSEKLGYAEIMTKLNATGDDLDRLLYSLSCSNYKILTKEPDMSIISSNDSFRFNSKFTSKMGRIEIPRPPPFDEKKKAFEDVERDRQIATDLAIVRIMKRTGVLGYEQLFEEVVEELGRIFMPEKKLVKERIEHLMERGYLERDKDNPECFNYLP